MGREDQVLKMRPIGIAIGLLALALGQNAPAQDRATHEELYRWFDNLKILDVAKTRLIVVQPNGSQDRFLAFLTSSNQERFECITLNLNKWTGLFKGSPGNGAYRATYQELDLKRPSGERIVQEFMPPNWARRGVENSILYAFLIARVMHSSHQTTLENQAWKYLESTLQTKLVDQIKANVGEGDFFQCHEALLDPQKSWPEVRDQFKAFSKHFPDAANLPDNKYTLEVLDRMASDEKRRRPVTKNETKDQQIADLIYRLRFDSIRFLEPPEDSAIGQLLKFDMAAVPALIKALGDDSFTKSFSRGRRAEKIERRVGDLAAEALFVISDRELEIPATLEFKTITPEIWAQATISRTERANKWLETYGKADQKEKMRSLIESGNSNRRDYVERLLAIDPKTAEAAVLKGLENAKDPNTAASLISSLGLFKTESAHEVLRAHLENDKNLMVKLVALHEVMKFDAPSALAVLVKLFQDLPSMKPDAYDRLMSALFKSRDVQTAEIAAQAFSKYPLEIQWRVLSTIGYGVYPPAKKGQIVPEPSAEQVAKFDQAVQSIMISALEVKTYFGGSSIRMGNGLLFNPRICDVASAALGHRYPAEFSFNFPATSVGAENQRRSCLNVIRKKRGEPPLSLLPLPYAQAVNPLRANQLVQQFTDFSTVAGREMIEEKLLELGPTAALAVSHKLAETDPNGPNYEPLLDLRTLLCNVVGEVVIEGDVPEAFSPAVEHLRTLKGKTLTSDSWIQELLLLTQQLSRPASFDISATRFAGSNGFSVTLRFIPPESQPGEGISENGLQTVVGQDVVFGAYGTVTSLIQDTGSRSEFYRSSIESALAAGPELFVGLSFRHSYRWTRINSNP